MLPFRKILFPLDYSERCLAVPPRVKEKLRHFDAADFRLLELKGQLGLDMPHAFLDGCVAEVIHQRQ